MIQEEIKNLKWPITGEFDWNGDQQLLKEKAQDKLASLVSWGQYYPDTNVENEWKYRKTTD